MLSKKVKLIINIFTILALIILLIVSWPQITEGLDKIGGAKISVILLMIPLQIINFLSIGKIYQSYFKNSGHNISTGFGLKLALELNFVNHVFPSGGVSGFSYLGVRLRDKGIPVARTTLAQVVRFALTFVSFLLLLFIGMFALSFGSGSSGGGVAMFIGLSIAFLTLFALIIAIYIVSSEKRIKAFTAFLPRAFNGILKPIIRKEEAINIKRIESLFSDFHKDYMLIAKDWRQLKRPFFWALLVNITEVSTAYLAYIALGHPVNPGAVILAYSVASFAGLIAILPGGIGVYEALMTAVLASAGVPKALALSATLIYRILTIIIFVPTGFVLYQIALRQTGMELKSGGKSNLNSN